MPQVVLVTGCSTGGIGYALCEEFARQGCKVYATSRRIETIEVFGNESIERLALDVTSDEDVKKGLDYIVEKEGKIDVVVNNAGIIGAGPLAEQPLDFVKQVFDTNAFSILRVCKAVVPIMASRHYGTIVNIGSVVGEVSTPWNGLYCASKAAVHSISEVLSMELKPLGIFVLHVAPGAVQSNIAANGTSRFALAPGSLYTDFLAMIHKRINASQERNSMPSDVFARKVVANALRKGGPPQYMTLGGMAFLFSILKWLPRSWALAIVWKQYSQRSTK
ncbi:unnamed protein product [Cyclocybe aegerita]|uniref:Ketoreductase domain-containing protein n=1 Tax=Cyclocybe aegerita TaxID=1973307 RepID=A0A8S0X3G5_CYCAE|nr:unnamed protein product [Cyclocybe aegerita]